MPDADATVSRIRVRGRRAGSAHARDRHRLSERPLGGGLRPESAGAALRRIPWPGPNRPYVAGDAAGGQQDTAHGGLDVARPWPGEFSRSLRRSEPRARQPPRCSGRHGRRRHRDPLRRRCLPVPGRDHFAAYNGTAPVEVSSGTAESTGCLGVGTGTSTTRVKAPPDGPRYRCSARPRVRLPDAGSN